MVNSSCPKVTYSDPKVTYTYIGPKVAYSDPRTTYTYSKGTYNDRKVTHSDPTHLLYPYLPHMSLSRP